MGLGRAWCRQESGTVTVVAYPGYVCCDFLLPIGGFPVHFLSNVFDERKF